MFYSRKLNLIQSWVQPFTEAHASFQCGNMSAIIDISGALQKWSWDESTSTKGGLVDSPCWIVDSFWISHKEKILYMSEQKTTVTDKYDNWLQLLKEINQDWSIHFLQRIR